MTEVVFLLFGPGAGAFTIWNLGGYEGWDRWTRIGASAGAAAATLAFMLLVIWFSGRRRVEAAVASPASDHARPPAEREEPQG